MRFRVDPPSLLDLARDLRDVRLGLGASSAVLDAAADCEELSRVGPDLAALSRMARSVEAEVDGLARRVVRAAGAFAEVESSVVAALERVIHAGEPAALVLTEVRDLFAALSTAERRELALRHPALVSGLASAPPADRFVATRVLVAADLARLGDRLRTARGAHRAQVERRLRLDRSLLAPGRQLLSFDPRGDGEVVEVFGDLDRARHLAVFVPGTGSGLDRYPGTAARAKAFADAAPDLAVVAWQRADFPDMPDDHVLGDAAIAAASAGSPAVVAQILRRHVFSAAFRDSADRAGPALRDDVEGLRLAAPGPGADVTVLGHSYGGSIVGSAEAHGLVVRRVVHISSAGAYVDDVHDYAAGACGTHRYSLTDPGDPIRLVQGVGRVGALGHGLDPDSLPGVTRLASGVQADGHTPVTGHSGMFTPGSTAWRNLLAVMRDQPVEALGPTIATCSQHQSW